MCMLAGDQVTALADDEATVTGELNDSIDGMIASAGIPTEAARRSVVPE